MTAEKVKLETELQMKRERNEPHRDVQNKLSKVDNQLEESLLETQVVLLD